MTIFIQIQNGKKQLFWDESKKKISIVVWYYTSTTIYNQYIYQRKLI